MAAPARVLKIRQGETPDRSLDSVTAVLNPLAEAVGATPIMGAAPPAWIRPDIISTSGLAQITPTSTVPLPLTSYHKDALGYVHGMVSLVAAAGSAAGVVAFNIDAGYRPADLLPFVMSDGGGLFWEVTIGPDGRFVVVTATGAGNIVTGTFTYLAVQ